MIAQRAQSDFSNGLLFARILARTPVHITSYRAFHPSKSVAGAWTSRVAQPMRSQRSHCNAAKAKPSMNIQQMCSTRTLVQTRRLHNSTMRRETAAPPQTTQEVPYRTSVKRSSDPHDEDVEENESEVFKKTERAERASQVNLSAKLSSPDKDGKDKASGGWREIVRLLKIASPEVKTLGLAFVFLLVSSSISMTVPFSIGKILDAATKEDEPFLVCRRNNSSSL